MIVETIAVGTELLLGQITDTNSAWLGQELSAVGINRNFHQTVGDNQARMVSSIRTALDRSDAVIVCGGLGPTHDDITREAIAEVLGAPLTRDGEMAERITDMMTRRGRIMAGSNLRQADKPDGAEFIVQANGSAPGLICPVTPKSEGAGSHAGAGSGADQVIYALPGVPWELAEMFQRAVLPDLVSRQSSGEIGVIASRVIRTWGISEARLGELVAPRIEALQKVGNPTIALLASGVKGITVRVTARATDQETAQAVLLEEESRIRELVGDAVFGTDEQTLQGVVAQTLLERGLTLGVAESLTGGMLGSRLVSVPGASAWFKGSIVSYATSVKQSLLSVPPGPVITEDAAVAMALGARHALDSSIGLGITGVAGPASEEGHPPGVAFAAIAGLADDPIVAQLALPGDRERIRQNAATSAIDLLRRQLR